MHHLLPPSQTCGSVSRSRMYVPSQTCMGKYTFELTGVSHNTSGSARYETDHVLVQPQPCPVNHQPTTLALSNTGWDVGVYWQLPLTHWSNLCTHLSQSSFIPWLPGVRSWTHTCLFTLTLRGYPGERRRIHGRNTDSLSFTHTHTQKLVQCSYNMRRMRYHHSITFIAQENILWIRVCWLKMRISKQKQEALLFVLLILVHEVFMISQLKEISQDFWYKTEKKNPHPLSQLSYTPLKTIETSCGG